MRWLKKYSPALIALLALLAIWEAAVAIFAIPGYLLPPPSAVFVALWQNLPSYMPHLWATLGEALLGLAIAVVLGVAIALLMHICKPLDRALAPLLVITQTIPILTVAPLLVVYLGFGILPKVFTVVLMCFFPITVSLRDSMRQMDSGYIWLLRSMGAKRLTIIREAELPFAAAGFVAGLKVSVTYAMTGAIVGEWLGSESGLGYLLIRAKNAYMLDRVFAILLLIVVASLLLFGMASVIERLLLPHRAALKKRDQNLL